MSEESEDPDSEESSQPEPAAWIVEDGERLLLVGLEEDYEGSMLWNSGDVEWSMNNDFIQDSLIRVGRVFDLLDELENRKYEIVDGHRKKNYVDGKDGEVVKKVIDLLRERLEHENEN